ncbi:Z1 domain protein [Rickettsia bellii str. RML Mogi]|uniref:Z1 domain protein n=1 Tax=Rickettsia bellii str. RML Mogi TaxID=1359194 RepID=A0A0F3QFL3_RICBE|nr:Z1 domain protein [Rickettsia bellii str. RML Mogi]
MLISTIDTISPDKLVLVKPGEGYIGGKEFFDTEDNPNVNVISDVDDFTSSIPNSFKKAMYYFLTICAIKQAEGDMGHYSMLVHPSSLNSVQEGVTEKIQRFFDVKISQIKNYKNLDEIERDDFDKDLNGALIEYKKTTDCSIDLEEIKKNIIKVIDNIDIKTINARYNINNEDDLVDEKLYTINIGGNILGRGLTIKKLVVSYIYRDSKESQIDTMYQRCR